MAFFRALRIPTTGIALMLASAGMADDWPGWMGPSRDGVLREGGIVRAISDDGLPVKWRIPIAGGYAGPAVANGSVYLFDYLKRDGEAFNNPGQRASLSGQERLLVLDAATGVEKWRHEYECAYSISYPAGPRCTPTVDDDRVYTLGSEGDLRCLDTNRGELIWSRSLKRDFAAEVPIWGFSAHPLVDGDLLYTMVGGDRQGIVAFDKMTGEVRWKNLDTAAGYCPPTIIEHGGARQLIVFHPMGIHGLDPVTGRVYWNVPMSPMYEMSINQPVIAGDLMYVSGIRTESVMLRLNNDRPDVTEVWRGEPKQAVYTANSTPQFVDGVVYGTDCNEGCLIAMDATTGERLWTTFEATRPDVKRFIKHGTAFLTRMGSTNDYLIFNELGDLLIANMTASGFESKGRFHVLEPTNEAFGRDVVWSHPAYADKTAFIRNDAEIVAVDLSE